MQKRKSVREALEKSSVFAERPFIPSHLQRTGLMQCEIRTYHHRLFKRNTKGKLRKTRFVSGYVFIFPIDENGNCGKKFIRLICASHMTRREFSAYARGFTETGSSKLCKALEKFAN